MHLNKMKLRLFSATIQCDYSVRRLQRAGLCVQQDIRYTFSVDGVVITNCVSKLGVHTQNINIDHGNDINQFQNLVYN